MAPRHSLASIITAVTLFGTVGAPPASAGSPDHFTIAFHGERINLCGMVVRQDGVVHGTFHEKHRRDGVSLVTFNEHWSIRLTNVATGRWVLSDTNGIARDMRVTENADGSITVLGAFSGNERYYDADGALFFHAAGTTRTRYRIDLVDPENPDDDVLLNEQKIKRAGLRLGNADCDTLRAFLT